MAPTATGLTVLAALVLAGGCSKQPAARERHRAAGGASSTAPRAAVSVCAERATLARKLIQSLEFRIEYQGTHDGDRSFRTVCLRVPDYGVEPTPMTAEVVIDVALAETLVTHLAADGFLGRAAPQEQGWVPEVWGRFYEFRLKTSDGQQVYRWVEALPWHGETFERLERLRGAVTGPAGQAVEELVAPLRPYREAWQRAAKDPQYLEERTRAAAEAIMAARAAKQNADYVALYREFDRDLPSILPPLLASKDLEVLHQALVWARDLCGLPELIPPAIGALDRLLETGGDGRDEGLTRCLACGLLGKARDERAVPVLLRALEDTYGLYEFHGDGGPDGHVEPFYRFVWLDADLALRHITGADPIPYAGGSRDGPGPGAQAACRKAWLAWLAANGPGARRP